MPRLQYAITNFSTGVVSPRLSNRLDPEVYTSALLQGRNFLITPQGGLLFRQGREHLNNTVMSRIFQFHRGGDLPDIMVQVSYVDVAETGPEGHVDLFTEDDWTTPFVALTNLLVPDDILTDGSLDPAKVAPFLEGFYFHNTERMGALAHPDLPPYLLLEDYGVVYTGRHIRADEIPMIRYTDSRSPSVAATVAEYSVTIPDGAGVDEEAWRNGDRYAVFYGNDIAYSGTEDGSLFFPVWEGLVDDTDTQAEVDARNGEQIVEALKGTIFLRGEDSVVKILPDGEMPVGSPTIIQISGRNAGLSISLESRAAKANAKVEQRWQGSLTGDITKQDELAWSYPTVVFHEGSYWRCIKPNWSGQTLNGEGTVSDPQLPGAWANNFTEPGVGLFTADLWEDLGPNKPWYYDWQYPDGNDWQGGFGVDGVLYGVGDRGFTNVAVFFQQRLIFMGNESGPTSVWGSRVGQYTDFQPGVNDADPFFFDLDTSDSPRIKWAEPSQSALIIGTSHGDFRLGGDVTLGPTDLQLTRQNSARSYKTRAVTLDNTAFYIEQGREKMRGTVYGEERRSWTSREYSLVAENLFRGKVNRVVMCRAPEPIAYVQRDDGNLIVMCWVPSGDYYQPSFMEVECRGAIVDICGYYSLEKEEDFLLLITNYEGNYALEALPYPERQIINENSEACPCLIQQGVSHLDSWVTKEITDEQFITVENRLTGTVTALIENAYLGEFQIVDGVIDLQEPYTGNLLYGYSYRGVAQTYETIQGNQRGATLGTKRRWNRVYVRCVDSTIPLINGQRAPERSPQKVMNIPDLLVSGIREIELRNLEWDDGSLLIEQDRPYPTHVVGVYGELSVENA